MNARSTRIRRHIDAPRAAVYRALVDARAVTTWMVPDGMTSHVHTFDAREGGAFHISLTYDEPSGTGKTTAHTDTYHGRFVELVPNERVVQVVEFETTDSTMRGEMTITLTLPNDSSRRREPANPIAMDNVRVVPTDVILKRFETPDEVREMQLGRFEIVRLGGVTIGRATYQPGWRWSEHVGPTVGATRCSVEHVGLVLAGTATAAFADGRVVELRAGELFYIPPEPHDSWVVGDEPYVSLHFLGADHYAK